MQARDEWIGWSDEQRRHNLQRIVGGGEKVRQFGGQKAPVEWLRLGYGPAQGPGRNSGRLVL